MGARGVPRDVAPASPRLRPGRATVLAEVVPAVTIDLTGVDPALVLRGAERRDGHHAEHGGRVADLARAMAEDVGGVDPDAAHRAGLLHDIGKVWLPFHPDDMARALTDGERNIVREHPRIGADAARIAGECPDVVEAVLLHHERIDGSGYPFGIGGSVLPRLAQIVAAADVWDALASERAYKPAWPRRLIERYFLRNGERWFEDRVLDSLARLAPRLDA